MDGQRMMTNDEREARAEAVVAAFASAFWSDRAWQLEQMLPDAQFALGIVTVPHGYKWFTRGMEPQSWLLMARAGLGLVEPTDINRAVVRKVCQTLAEWLFVIPGAGIAYTIPDSWYESEMGAIWAAALIWCEGGELVTQAEAARLLGVSVSTIASRIDRGRLAAFTDPSAPSRQGRRLVRRRDILPQ